LTESEYQQWWQYHIRVARGESLNEEEQVIYCTGIDALDHEEVEQLQLASLKDLRQLRSKVQRLTQNLGQLTTRSEQLSHKIAILEQTYQQLTGYSLLMDAHVPS
jgi:hypothetical protein